MRFEPPHTSAIVARRANVRYQKSDRPGNGLSMLLRVGAGMTSLHGAGLLLPRLQQVRTNLPAEHCDASAEIFSMWRRFPAQAADDADAARTDSHGKHESAPELKLYQRRAQRDARLPFDVWNPQRRATLHHEAVESFAPPQRGAAERFGAGQFLPQTHHIPAERAPQHIHAPVQRVRI